MRAVFQDLGCSSHTAKAMAEDQGIDTLDDLCFLKDGDVETLCKNVKHPGGAAGGNNRSANLGHLVSSLQLSWNANNGVVTNLQARERLHHTSNRGTNTTLLSRRHPMWGP